MKYEDIINGLAEEMLEKIASEIDEEEVVEEVASEEVEELTEEEIEQLAEEMYMEELQKLAEAEEETELEKEAEAEEEAELEKEANLKGIKTAIKGAATKVAPKGFKNAKANKEMAEAALGGALNPHNPALKKYKKEKAKLVAGAGATAAGTAGAIAYGRKKVQEKAASYFEEAEFLKQAAEEAYQEAIMMQDAAVKLYNRMEEE